MVKPIRGPTFGHQGKEDIESPTDGLVVCLFGGPVVALGIIAT
jgi:hypothetical protein